MVVMKLSDTDKKMLDGTQGPAKQKAMELIVRYGRIAGAEALCTVTWADLFCGSFPRPNTIQLKSFFAALACAAGTEICHIPGNPDAAQVPIDIFIRIFYPKRNANEI